MREPDVGRFVLALTPMNSNQTPSTEPPDPRIVLTCAAFALFCGCGGVERDASVLTAPERVGAVEAERSATLSASSAMLRTAGRSPVETGSDDAELRSRIMDPFEVRVLGLRIADSAEWRLVVAVDDGTALQDLQLFGIGRGSTDRLWSSLATERALARDQVLLLLATDGSFFGTLRAGPGLLETRAIGVEVTATAALELVALRGSEPLDAKRDSFGHRITTRLSPVDEFLFAQRLAAGKWLPAGEYKASLESSVLRAEARDVFLRAGTVQRVEFQCSPREDLVDLVLEVRSAAGEEHTDFPLLEITDGPGRELYGAPEDPGVVACGPRLYHYRQLPDRLDGTWGFRLHDWQPESLSITTDEVGTLIEHRDPVRNGVLRIVLDWTPERIEPEPR